MRRASLLALLLASTPAAAQSLPTEKPFSLDLEIDPIAYALAGHSLHAGFRTGSLRFDLGTFAIAVPEGFHGEAGVERYTSGFGLKVDHHFTPNQDGLFVGADAGLLRETYRLRAGGTSEEQDVLSVGVRAGYTIPLPSGFYLAPWLGVSYGFGAEEVQLGDRVIEAQPVTFFPTIHVGFRS